MEVVLLLEFEADAAPQRTALLERVGSLTLQGQAKLSFVGSEPDGRGGSARSVVALGLARFDIAQITLERWRAEGIVSAATRARILSVEPVWSMEPLALMFP